MQTSTWVSFLLLEPTKYEQFSFNCVELPHDAFIEHVIYDLRTSNLPDSTSKLDAALELIANTRIHQSIHRSNQTSMGMELLRVKTEEIASNIAVIRHYYKRVASTLSYLRAIPYQHVRNIQFLNGLIYAELY